MSSKNIDVRRFNVAPYAACCDCDRLHLQATRERVRQHVDKTGHTVHVVIENRTVYKPIQEQAS